MVKTLWPALSVLLTLGGCFSQAPELSTLAGQTMGSNYLVQYLPSENSPPAPQLQREMEQTLEELNRQMSTYQEDSEIGRFNRLQAGQWMALSPDFYRVLEYSLELAKKTGGAFDPTLGPLINLWGFGPTGTRKVPTQEQIAVARKRVGFQHLELSKAKRSARKKIAELTLDLSASAKGFAVDKIAGLLENHAIKNYLVEIGGELKALGQKASGPWQVAIEAPHKRGDGPESAASMSRPYQKVLPVRDRAVATSGDYRNFFKDKGQTYSHILDFKSGRPIGNALASVTVAESQCLVADALATALMAMETNRAFQFAEAEGIAAYFIYRQGKNLVTRASSLFAQTFGD